MLRKLAHDADHDVTLFQTSHTGPDFHVRYGLQVEDFEDLTEALDAYRDALSHAISCNHNI